MRLLLDSQALLWWAYADRRLSAKASGSIQDAGNEIAVSPFSAYEIQFKANLGKLAAIDFAKVVAAIAAARFQEAPFTIAMALTAANLPLIHRDPFDRLLIAQGLHGGWTIVTTDRDFARYGVPVLW